MNCIPTQMEASPNLVYGLSTGEGSPLLLLHGVTRGWRDWEAVIASLDPGWQVLAVDQRGHGRSPRRESYLVTDYVRDAVAFVKQQATTPVVIFGHSLGAMVAAAVAAEIPEAVRGVVLEDPPFHSMGKRIGGSVWQAQFVGMRDVGRRGGTLEEVTDGLADIQLPTKTGGFRRLGELRDRSSLSWSAECLKQLDPEVLTPVIEGRWLDGYDVPAVAAKIRCPVLLLQADPDAGGALSEADAEEFLVGISSARRQRFPGAGHQLHRDHPQRVLQAFADFAASFASSSS
jgi:pimeloyl-ACP methyl ester carboxylesterase